MLRRKFIKKLRRMLGVSLGALSVSSCMMNVVKAYFTETDIEKNSLTRSLIYYPLDFRTMVWQGVIELYEDKKKGLQTDEVVLEWNGTTIYLGYPTKVNEKKRMGSLELYFL